MPKFYTDIVSKRISDLLLGVVGVGILVVSFEYTQFAYDNPGNLGGDFAQRVVLMLLVIGFTAYNFLAYAAYWAALKGDRESESQIEQSAPESGGQIEQLAPVRIVAMYLLDLLQVTITAWLYALLLIGNVTDASDLHTDDVGFRTLFFLFLFSALWHVTVFWWYVARGGTDRNKKLHASFAGVCLFGALAFSVVVRWELGLSTRELFSFDQTLHPVPASTDWLAILYYGVYVALMYWKQGIYYLRKTRDPRPDRVIEELSRVNSSLESANEALRFQNQVLGKLLPQQKR